MGGREGNDKKDGKKIKKGNNRREGEEGQIKGNIGMNDGKERKDGMEGEGKEEKEGKEKKGCRGI